MIDNKPKSMLFIAMLLLIYISFIVCADCAFTPPIWDSPTATATRESVSSGTPIASGSDLNQKSDSSNYHETIQKAYFPSNYDSSPIELEKSIEPNETSDYVVNAPIDIRVLIRSSSSYNLTDLIIKEETDADLEIKNDSAKLLIIDPVHESFNKINYSNGYSMNKINDNTISTSISCLRPQKWISYTYTVVPKKRGFLNADTLVNFGNNSYYKSKYASWGIRVNPEKFEVVLVPGKDEEYSDTNIGLSYKIKYLGNNPNTHNFNVRLEDSSQEFICVNNKTRNLTFNSSEYGYYCPTIRYKKIGTHYLPNILINDIPYSADGPQTICIDDYIIRNKEFLNFGIAILNIVVAAFNIIVFLFVSLYYREFKNIETTLRGIQEELHKMRESNTSENDNSP